MYKTFLITALVVLTSLLNIPASRAAEPIEIDAILSMTGPGSFIGHDTAEGLNAIAELVNEQGGIAGQPVKIVVHDDQTNPQVTVELFNAIAAAHKPIVFGPSIAATCGAILPLAQNVVAYCFSPAVHPPVGSYMFSAGNDSSDQFTVALTYAARRGLTRVATLTSTDASGQDAERGISAAAAGIPGIDIVSRERFGTADISVAAQLARIKASGAQVLFAWSSGTPFGTLLRGINDAGLNLPVITTTGNMSFPQLRQYVSIMPNELLFPATIGSTPQMVTNTAAKATLAAFGRALAKEGESRPSYTSLVVVDPMMVVLDGLRKFGPNANATQLRDFVATLNNWVGINGRYDYQAKPQRGLGINSIVMARWVPKAERFDPVSSPGGTPLTR